MAPRPQSSGDVRFNPVADDAVKQAARVSLARRYSHVERILADQPYLLDGRFTVADAYLFVVSSWAPHVEVDLSAFGNLQAFMARVGARPAVRQALRAEGLLN